MKNLYLLLIAPLFLITTVQCTQKNAEKGNGKWKLAWEDEFKGKAIDTNKWGFIPRGNSEWNKYMSDNPSLYEFKDGNLIIRGIENTVAPDDTASLLTGGVYTKDLKTFGYGRLEIRAKLKPSIGAWPAFWMLPQSEPKWPSGGEIDILERLSHDKFIYQTVHSDYTQTLGIKDNPPASSIVGMNPNNYNVYALEKYPDSLVFYINETKTKNYPRIETEQDGQFPFGDEEFYLMLNMQLGGSWVGSVNLKELPAEIYIDWVRFYELNEDFTETK